MVLAAQLSAQKPAPTAAAAAKAGFDEVSGWLVASAELVPADKYTYKPVNTVRSYGQLMAHAADGMNWYCASATATGEVQWSDAVEKSATTKAAVVQGLKAAVAKCNAAYAAPNAQIHRLMGNIAHANLHYGNAITYIRMLGLKPPSS
jgi:uncharacterized damage-inducible protein DinB